MNGIMALRFGPEEVTGDLGKSSFSGVERTEDRMKYRVLLYTAVIGIRGIHSSPKPFNGTWWAKSLTGRNRFSPSRNFVCLHCSEISPREHKLKHACFFFFFFSEKERNFAFILHPPMWNTHILQWAIFFPKDLRVEHFLFLCVV